MTLRFLSPQTDAVACDVGLLDLLSEFIDANADTVDLMTGRQRTELEWSAHCDYLRALQRLGHETLARHDRRMPAAPVALAVVSGVNSALTRGWTAALLILRSPPLVPLRRSTPPRRRTVSAHSRVRGEHAERYGIRVIEGRSGDHPPPSTERIVSGRSVGSARRAGGALRARLGDRLAGQRQSAAGSGAGLAPAADRPLACFDDELHGDAYAWAAARRIPTKLLSTDARRGIVDEEVRSLLAFARRALGWRSQAR
jgi:hypothetical protein